jgi:hypothetical protein
LERQRKIRGVDSALDIRSHNNRRSNHRSRTNYNKDSARDGGDADTYYSVGDGGDADTYYSAFYNASFSCERFVLVRK